MIRTCARSIAGVVLSFIAANLTQAQTMELFAGGGRFADLPATEIGLQVRDMVVGPDGYIYILDPNKYLMRFDPAAGTITTLPLHPSHPDGANFDLGYPDALAFDGAGQLHVATGGSLYVLDLNDGARLNLGPLPDADQMAFGPDDTLYFVTPEDSRIRARSPAGAISIVAGTGEAGFSGDGGPATAAMLGYPRNLAIAANGDIYFADGNNNRVRRIDIATGLISTVAGTGDWEFNAEGLPATQTSMSPNWVAFDPAGNLLIGDAYRLLRVDAGTGLVSSIAGIGTWYGGGSDGGPATAALVVMPRSMVFDAAGNLYFAQTNDNPIPGHSVRKISPSTGIITRAIGNNTFYFCGDGQPARAACLLGTNGLGVSASGSVVIVDSNSRRLRRVPSNTGVMETVDIGPGNNEPYGAEYDAAGNIYFTSWQSNRVFRLDATTGERTVVVGGGGGVDGGLASNAAIGLPTDIAFDGAQNMYVIDTTLSRVRKVDAITGIISHYAGNGPYVPLGDGGPATAARLFSPSRIAFDSANNLFIVEGQGCRIRKVDPVTGIISTVAGNGTCGGPTASGVPGPSTSIGMYAGLAVDATGNIFLSWDGTIHRVDAATGIITRVSPFGGFTTPEGLRIQGSIADMEFDSQGRLYIDQQYGRYVFRITGLVGDTSPPVVTADVSGTLGNNGWYRSNVTVNWSVSDAESAIGTSSGCASTVVTENTAGLTLICSATSAGGTTTQSVTIRKDTAAPLITLLYPEAGRNYGAFSTTNVQYSCVDSYSTPVSCVGTVPSGSPLPTNSPGAKTFTVTATDAAGNVTTVSRNYSVATMQFEAWVEPLRRSPITNGITAGQLVPIRWRLLDGVGGRVTNPAAFQSLNASVLTCQSAVVPLSGSASGGPGLSVNPSNGVFTYNWQTTAGSTGCRRVILTFADNSSRELWFSF
jgi:sugar lactone lactonase YvrE